jgi:hypothetical protein
MHLGVIVLTVGVGACSTTSYIGPVTQLNQGLTTAQAAFERLKTRVQQVDLVRSVDSGVTQGTPLTLAPCKLTQDPNKDLSNCALMLGKRPVHGSDLAPKGSKLLAAFIEYGHGLQQLVAAKDTSDLDSSVNNLNSALENIAKISGATAAQASVVSSSLDLIQWFFGQYLEYERIKVLKASISAGDQAVKQAVPLLEAEARTLQKIATTYEPGQLQSMVLAVSLLKNASFGERIELEKDTIAYQASVKQLMEVDAAAPFEQLKEAHARLLQAAQASDFSAEDLKAALTDFYKKSKALYDAVNK